MPMKKNLTERQQEIYSFIRSTIGKRGMPPTLREIGGRFGIRSTNGVEGHLAALETHGLINRERGKSRGIVVRSTEHQTAAIPLIGRVTAGQPVFSPENMEGEVMVDLSLFSIRRPDNIFALRVKGESMVNAHITDGDILLVSSKAFVQNGDIVVALVEGEATVKRFFEEEGRIRLQPENDAMEPLVLDHGDINVLGKAVGVVRRIG
jgi:repressor LexA